MKENYTQAVIAMIEAGNEPEMVIAGLKTTLTAHGHQALLGSVLHGVVRIMSAKDLTGAEAFVASEADKNKYAAAIATALAELDTQSEPTVTVDETLVGGFVVEANNRRLDHSYKSKLVKLYRSLTA